MMRMKTMMTTMMKKLVNTLRQVSTVWLPPLPMSGSMIGTSLMMIVIMMMMMIMQFSDVLMHPLPMSGSTMMIMMMTIVIVVMMMMTTTTMTMMIMIVLPPIPLANCGVHCQTASSLFNSSNAEIIVIIIMIKTVIQRLFGVFHQFWRGRASLQDGDNAEGR